MIRIVYTVFIRRESFCLDPYFFDFERDTSNLPHIWKLHYLLARLNNSTVSALQTDVSENCVANFIQSVSTVVPTNKQAEYPAQAIGHVIF